MVWIWSSCVLALAHVYMRHFHWAWVNCPVFVWAHGDRRDTLCSAYMNVSSYVIPYMYIYIHTNVYDLHRDRHIYTYIYMPTYVYIRIYLCINVYIYIHGLIHVYNMYIQHIPIYIYHIYI